MFLKKKSIEAIKFVVFMCGGAFGGIIPIELGKIFIGISTMKYAIIICSIPFIAIAILLLIFYKFSHATQAYSANSSSYSVFKNLTATFFMGSGVGSSILLLYLFERSYIQHP